MGGEHFRGPGGGGAVDPHPGDVPAPGLRAGLRIGQPGEVLPGLEVPADVLHGPFHLRLAPHRQLHPIQMTGTEGCG